jgi:hypothetical protein
MLLGTHSNRDHFIATLSDFLQTSENHPLGCIGPDLRILLDVAAREPFDERMWRARLGENFSAISVQNHAPAGGRPAIEA